MRRGFTVVEIVLGLVLMSLLTSITYQSYSSSLEQSKETALANSLVGLKERIQKWQIEAKRPWFRPTPPPDWPLDPWDQRLQIDPRRGVAWSRGPHGDREFEDAPAAHRVRWAPFPGPAPAAPRRVQASPRPGGGVVITWQPSAARNLIGYQVERAPEVTIPAIPASPGDPGSPPRTELGAFTVLGEVSPEAPPEVVDPSATAGQAWYYRVRSLPGPGASGKAAPSAAARVVLAAAVP